MSCGDKRSYDETPHEHPASNKRPCNTTDEPIVEQLVDWLHEPSRWVLAKIIEERTDQVGKRQVRVQVIDTDPAYACNCESPFLEFDDTACFATAHTHTTPERRAGVFDPDSVGDVDALSNARALIQCPHQREHRTAWKVGTYLQLLQRQPCSTYRWVLVVVTSCKSGTHNKDRLYVRLYAASRGDQLVQVRVPRQTVMLRDASREAIATRFDADRWPRLTVTEFSYTPKIEDYAYVENQVSTEYLDKLTCTLICKEVLNDPYQHECGKMFCKGCLQKCSTSEQAIRGRCPSCRKEMKDKVMAAPQAIREMINELKVKCKFCNVVVQRDTIDKHWQQQCERACRHAACFTHHTGLERLRTHESEACAYATVRCTALNKAEQCPWRGRVADLISHNETCLFVRVEQVEAQISELRKQVESTRNAIRWEVPRELRNLAFIRKGALVDYRGSKRRWYPAKVKVILNHTIVQIHLLNESGLYNVAIHSDALAPYQTHTYGDVAKQNDIYAGRTKRRRCACGDAEDCFGAPIPEKPESEDEEVNESNS